MIRLAISKDTRAQNTCVFTIQREDHTLGNLLCNATQKQPHVTFAGYAVPHPLEHLFVLRIQTSKESTPKAALKSAINDTIVELDTIKESFAEQVHKMRTERY